MRYTTTCAPVTIAPLASTTVPTNSPSGLCAADELTIKKKISNHLALERRAIIIVHALS